MKVGEVIESAIWLSGEENEQMIQAFKDRVRINIDEEAKKWNVVVGPMTWVIKKPGDDRVPPVPDAIQGINVQLLVGEAMVLGPVKPVIMASSGFVYDLRREDLLLLRKITRKAHQRRQPGSGLTDAQCDAVIEQLGPEAALRTLRNGHLDA